MDPVPDAVRPDVELVPELVPLLVLVDPPDDVHGVWLVIVPVRPCDEEVLVVELCARAYPPIARTVEKANAPIIVM